MEEDERGTKEEDIWEAKQDVIITFYSRVNVNEK